MLNKVILTSPKDIISSVGSSSCLNVIYISIIALIAVLFISFLFKKFQGKDILDVSEFLGGKILKITIGILSIIFLLSTLISVIKNFSEMLNLMYFRTSPYIYVLLFFVLTSAIANKFSIKVLTKTNLIIIPVIFFSIIIVLLSSLQDIVPQLIFPIWGYGINQTFFSGLTNLFSFSGLYYLLFLNPFIFDTKQFKKISVTSIVISGIYLFLSVICLLLSTSFSFNNNESLSLYLLTRTLGYGRFFQRVDTIFIFIWILTTISYMSIAMYFCIFIFKKITNISSSSTINYTFHILLLALLALPTNSAFLDGPFANFTKIGTLTLTYIVSILILILANFKKKFKNST